MQRSLTVSCKQWQLQIGGLGWEDSFIDCSLYRNYCILDADGVGIDCALRLQGKAYTLPIQSESMDLIVLPHMLEFDKYRFQTLREVERVLKPGGEVILLNFNPLSLSVRYQYLLDRKLADSWASHFISRTRAMDWLKLLNFEIQSTAEFYLDTFVIRPGSFRWSGRSVFSMAYGLKAVKRSYRLIPVGETGGRKPRLLAAGGALKYSSLKKEQHD